jgi:hypothetical protein
MALVAGIGDGFKELAVAPRAADVLGWAVALGLASIKRGSKIPGSGSIKRSILMMCYQPSPKS